MGFWPVTENVIKNSDIVLLVIDARMPELSKSDELEKKINKYNKKMIMVFNKIDISARSVIKGLHEKFPEAVFVSVPKRIGISDLKKRIIELSGEMDLEEGDDPRVGVVGYPNVGKSSIINLLSGRSSARVSPVAGTTRGNQWIKAGNFKIIDSPGVIPSDDRDGKLGLLAAKDAEKIKNPELVALQILTLVLQKSKKRAEVHYKIELKDEPMEALLQIGQRRGFLSKGGIVDETRTSINIIQDWQRGKLRL